LRFAWIRALAAAAATVRGAENFGPKSRGKKKLKKAKFKSLTEGSLMSDTEEENVGEDYQLDRVGDPSYRDVQSELLGLPHRSPSQRKRKAPRLLEEELSAEKHSKKLKKDPLVRATGSAGFGVCRDVPGANSGVRADESLGVDRVWEDVDSGA